MASKLVGSPVALAGRRLLILPLYFLPLRARLGRRRPAGFPPQAARTLLSLASVAVLLSAASALSDSSSPSCRDQILSELQMLKLKTAQLESILEDSTEKLNSRASQMEEKKKLVMDMEQTIQLLKIDLHEIKGSFSGLLHTEDQIHSLEAEVQLLWDQSRKNKDSIDNLKSSTDNAKENIKIVNSQVEKMESMVTEQWIQIQKLEQAFQITKIMTSKVSRRRLQSNKYQNMGARSFIKKVVQVFRGFRRSIPDVANPLDPFFLGASISRSSMSQTYSQFKRIISYGQKYHYQLQNWIEDVVGTHESTDLIIIIIRLFITLLFALLITSLTKLLTWAIHM